MIDDDDDYALFGKSKISDVVRKSSEIFDHIYNRNFVGFKECLDAGVSLNAIRGGVSLLSVTISQDYEEAFQELLSRKVDLTSPAEDTFNTPFLSNAILENNLSFFRMLLKEGADLNAIDNRGVSVFHQAVKSFNKSLVEELMLKDFNPNTFSPLYQETPLMAVVKLGWSAIAEKMVDEKGALVSRKINDRIYSAIDVAQENSPNLVDWLTEKEVVLASPSAQVEVVKPAVESSPLEEAPPALVSTISRGRR